MALADLLARVRVAGVSGVMTSDLARELLEELSTRADRSERRALRDDTLRRAAALIPGSDWEKANALASRVRDLGALRYAAPGSDPVRTLVLEALAIDPETPRGWRQLLRVIHTDPQ